jgi:hypothetical protein
MILCEITWYSTGDEEYRFFTNREAIYSFMDRCEEEGNLCSVLEIAKSLK